MVRFTWDDYLYQKTAKVFIKTYIIVLRTVYIFVLSMHIDSTKLTFKYFRWEINRRRTARSEVVAVVCIHPWKTFVHIQTCFWNRIEHVKGYILEMYLVRNRWIILSYSFYVTNCFSMFTYVSWEYFNLLLLLLYQYFF